ncbi:hypothetical protein [Flindersiella endophytica]
MKTFYKYKIALLTEGRWQVTVVEKRNFSRDPRSIARQLLEQWIIGQQGHLPGGRIVVVYGGNDGAPAGIIPTVRVQVYRSGPTGEDGPLTAAAYLGHAMRDYGAA